MLVLLVLWRASLGRLAVGLALVGLVMYVAAAWLLPRSSVAMDGLPQAEGLFTRFGDAPGCSSRSVLWSNVLYLIAQRPWLGWGWGSWTMPTTSRCFGESGFVCCSTMHTICHCTWQ